MAPKKSTSPDESRIALAKALGFTDYPCNKVAEPYLNYIANRHIGRRTSSQYHALFVRVIGCFNSLDEHGIESRTIQSVLDELVSSDTEDHFEETATGSNMRKEDVEDTVMYILGVWSLMLSSFVHLPNGARGIDIAYRTYSGMRNSCNTIYKETPAGLIQRSGLLPSPRVSHQPQNVNRNDEILETARKLITLLSGPERSVSGSCTPPTYSLLEIPSADEPIPQSQIYASSETDSIESLSIKAKRLNAFALNILGAVDIVWTHNISRHMLFSRKYRGNNTLEIFALPCVFDSASLTSEAVGVSSELIQEIQESYSILFNAWSDRPLHARLRIGLRRFCLCWSCSAYRYRKQMITKLRKDSGRRSREGNKTPSNSKCSEFDPQLVALMNSGESTDWAYEIFPSLWPRIIALEEHLQEARPWSIWILFRDRRDTLQFYTFLFATIVVFLTLMQVLLGIAQVVGTLL